MSSYTSPAIDIVSFFSTSLPEDLYQTKRDYLLNVYLETLGSVMKRLGCERRVIAMDELKDSLVEFAIYELQLTCSFRPVIMSRREEAQDIDEIFDNEEMANVKILRNPAFREIIVNRLPYFDEIGLFN